MNQTLIYSLCLNTHCVYCRALANYCNSNFPTCGGEKRKSLQSSEGGDEKLSAWTSDKNVCQYCDDVKGWTNEIILPLRERVQRSLPSQPPTLTGKSSKQLFLLIQHVLTSVETSLLNLYLVVVQIRSNKLLSGLSSLVQAQFFEVKFCSKMVQVDLRSFNSFISFFSLSSDSISQSCLIRKSQARFQTRKCR